MRFDSNAAPPATKEDSDGNDAAESRRASVEAFRAACEASEVDLLTRRNLYCLVEEGAPIKRFPWEL